MRDDGKGRRGTATPVEELIAEFARTTEEIFSLEELRRKLESGKKLRIKFGADVTAAFLHIGHAVNLRMMRRLQEDGHRVLFLIGDFTTRIGDPTGKSQTRKEISRESIEENAARFIEQVGKILITDDPEVFEVRRNSEWFDRMSADRFLGLLSRVTLARLSERDMFRRRVEEGAEIRVHEMIYPVLQGWDSVELESDLTIVGSDQLFNEMMGRFFQTQEGQCGQVIVTTKITPGLDGVKKQSKSLGNYIAMEDSPSQMFGKAMSLPDGLICQWLRVYTKVPMERVEELEAELDRGSVNPRDAKLLLAEEIVASYHGETRGRRERDWFLATFSDRSFPENAPTLVVTSGELAALELARMALPGRSSTELRRLIGQGGFWFQSEGDVGGKERMEKIENPFRTLPLERGRTYRLRLGKRDFRRVRVE